MWNDPRSLERHVRKADILLVDGDTRVAQIIQYLTKSCWSHAGLYVGDELVRRGGPAAEAAIAAYGEEGARHLMIEALPDGVVATPITKYIDYTPSASVSPSLVAIVGASSSTGVTVIEKT